MMGGLGRREDKGFAWSCVEGGGVGWYCRERTGIATFKPNLMKTLPLITTTTTTSSLPKSPD